MATKPVLRYNCRSCFAEATRLDPPFVSGDHHAQQFHDGVATMRAFEFPWGHAWQPASFETGLPIPFHGGDGARTRNLCQEMTASINSMIWLRQCPPSRSQPAVSPGLQQSECERTEVAAATRDRHCSPPRVPSRSGPVPEKHSSQPVKQSSVNPSQTRFDQAVCR